MEIVEKCFKVNDDFVEANFVKNREQFEKQRRALWQLSNVNESEITDDSSIIERALLQFLNETCLKSERKHFLMHSPLSQSSNKQFDTEREIDS
jgi:hypothetical protein